MMLPTQLAQCSVACMCVKKHMQLVLPKACACIETMSPSYIHPLYVHLYKHTMKYEHSLKAAQCGKWHARNGAAYSVPMHMLSDAVAHWRTQRHCV